MAWAEHPGFAVTNCLISLHSRSKRACFWVPLLLGKDINGQNRMNRYQRFVGTSLKRNGLRRFPVGRCQFLGLPVSDDGVNVVEAPVHAVNLELHAKFSHAVSLQGFVLLVVKVNGGKYRALVRTANGEGVAGVAQGGSEVPIVRVVHPD